MRCLVLRTSNYPGSPVNGWLPSEIYFQDYVFTLLREIKDVRSKPCGLHGAGMTSRLATGSVGWGMRTKWKKHLPMTERSCHTFLVKCKLLIGWKVREKCLHTNRFTLNMRDRGLVPESGQCRQAERAAAGSRCQRTVLDPSSSSALCSDCRDGRNDLCTLKVSSTL